MLSPLFPTVNTWRFPKILTLTVNLCIIHYSRTVQNEAIPGFTTQWPTCCLPIPLYCLYLPDHRSLHTLLDVSLFHELRPYPLVSHVSLPKDAIASALTSRSFNAPRVFSYIDPGYWLLCQGLNYQLPITWKSQNFLKKSFIEDLSFSFVGSHR